jgi:hypothetical protein
VRSDETGREPLRQSREVRGRDVLGARSATGASRRAITADRRFALAVLIATDRRLPASPIGLAVSRTDVHSKTMSWPLIAGAPREDDVCSQSNVGHMARALQVVTLPRHLRSTGTISLVVGTVLFAINQLDIVLEGDATVVTWLKIGLTYLVPFVVSNLGILTATRHVTITPAP